MYKVVTLKICAKHLQNIWLNWTPEMQNLNPVQPEWFRQAYKFPIDDLPEVMADQVTAGRLVGVVKLTLDEESCVPLALVAYAFT